MPEARFDELLEAIESLPPEAQADLLDIARRRLAERGRKRLLEEIREAEAQVDAGLATRVSVEELMREIDT